MKEMISKYVSFRQLDNRYPWDPRDTLVERVQTDNQKLMFLELDTLPGCYVVGKIEDIKDFTDFLGLKLEDLEDV